MLVISNQPRASRSSDLKLLEWLLPELYSTQSNCYYLISSDWHTRLISFQSECFEKYHHAPLKLAMSKNLQSFVVLFHVSTTVVLKKSFFCRVKNAKSYKWHD